jgi:hypothetical protein
MELGSPDNMSRFNIKSVSTFPLAIVVSAASTKSHGVPSAPNDIMGQTLGLGNWGKMENENLRKVNSKEVDVNQVQNSLFLRNSLAFVLLRRIGYMF